MLVNFKGQEEVSNYLLCKCWGKIAPGVKIINLCVHLLIGRVLWHLSPDIFHNQIHQITLQFMQNKHYAKQMAAGYINFLILNTATKINRDEC